LGTNRARNGFPNFKQTLFDEDQFVLHVLYVVTFRMLPAASLLKRTAHIVTERLGETERNRDHTTLQKIVSYLLTKLQTDIASQRALLFQCALYYYVQDAAPCIFAYAHWAFRRNGTKSWSNLSRETDFHWITHLLFGHVVHAAAFFSRGSSLTIDLHKMLLLIGCRRPLSPKIPINIRILLDNTPTGQNNQIPNITYHELLTMNMNPPIFKIWIWMPTKLNLYTASP